MSVPEEPLERVNYFNGQRLEAVDFRTDQDYQLRVRRWLNRSLYSPGVVKGLEVGKHPSDSHKVLVLPGLAFDIWGREIILVDTREVPVKGVPSTTEGVVFGNYLVISYAEERTLPVSDGCAVASDPKPCRGDLAWGAPTRIRAEPRLEFVDSWPADETGKAVLAQIELKNCAVKAVNQGVRKYAVPPKPPKARPISLEGEKDIDRDNPKVLYFHITGSYPQTAVLYLHASKFSSLFYTELGNHTHGAQLAIQATTQNFDHTHGVSNATIQPAGGHAHRLFLDGGGENDGVDRNDSDECSWAVGQIEPVDHHTHTLTGLTLDAGGGSKTHTHNATLTIGDTGATDASAHTDAGTKALAYVKNLRILFDRTQDITQKVLDQLKARPGQSGRWNQLGDGTKAHELVSRPEGTSDIDLLRLDIDLSPGEHSLTFKLNDSGVGGQIHYNLYVE